MSLQRVACFDVKFFALETRGIRLRQLKEVSARRQEPGKRRRRHRGVAAISWKDQLPLSMFIGSRGQESYPTSLSSDNRRRTRHRTPGIEGNGSALTCAGE